MNGARNWPRRAGLSWSRDEDERLLSALERGETVEAIAEAHERTTVGIEARIERLQLAHDPEV